MTAGTDLRFSIEKSGGKRDRPEPNGISLLSQRCGGGPPWDALIGDLRQQNLN